MDMANAVSWLLKEDCGIADGYQVKALLNDCKYYVYDTLET